MAADSPKITQSSTLQYHLVKNKGFAGYYDRNEDSQIDASELSKLAEDFNLDVKDLLQKMDFNKSGSISDIELQHGFKAFKEALYDSLDPKGKGFIDKQEIKKLSDSLGVDADKVFDRLDKDRDGVIKKNEFIRYSGAVLHHLERFKKEAVQKENQAYGPTAIVSLDRRSETGSVYYANGKVSNSGGTSQSVRALGDDKEDVEDFVKSYDVLSDTFFSDNDWDMKGYLSDKDVDRIASVLHLKSDKLMSSLDADLDGKVTKAEFKAQFSKVLRNFKDFQKEVPQNVENEADDPGWQLLFDVKQKITTTKTSKEIAQNSISNEHIKGRIDLFG